MIHATIIEHYEGDERASMNADLLERSKKASEDADALRGPVRRARAGETFPVPDEWKRRAMTPDAAVAALGAVLPKGGR